MVRKESGKRALGPGIRFFAAWLGSDNKWFLTYKNLLISKY